MTPKEILIKNAEKPCSDAIYSHSYFEGLDDTIIASMEEYAEPYKNALADIKLIALSRKKGSIEAILKVIGELEK